MEEKNVFITRRTILKGSVASLATSAYCRGSSRKDFTDSSVDQKDDL